MTEYSKKWPINRPFLLDIDYYMASVISGKTARFDWLRNIFSRPLFSRNRPHGPKRVILLSDVNKLCNANSKTQNKETKNHLRMWVEGKTLEKQFNFLDDTIWNDLFFIDEN